MRSRFFQNMKLDELKNYSKQTGERTFGDVFIYEELKKL